MNNRIIRNIGVHYGYLTDKVPQEVLDELKPPIDKLKNNFNLGNSWNRVMPTKRDMSLLASTVFYTELVINVGSSMVFDYAAQNKPCAYLNYNTEKTKDTNWDIDKIYKYIHFQSMPSKEAVLWINNINEIEAIIIKGLNKNKLNGTKEWYKIICGENPSDSSGLIWKTIQEILD